MSTEANKAIVARWFDRFWGKDFDPAVIDELAAPDIRFEYSLHAPVRGRDEVRDFATKFRAAFPDLNFWGTADLIAEGDYVVGQWEGGGTQTGAAFGDMPVGSLPAATGKTMRFAGITVLKVENGLITEEIGLDDGLTALRQLGLITSAEDDHRRLITGRGCAPDPGMAGAQAPPSSIPGHLTKTGARTSSGHDR